MRATLRSVAGDGHLLAMLDFVNFYLIPGLVLGCIYALGAIGVSLICSASCASPISRMAT